MGPELTGIIFIVALASYIWGMIGKTMAVAKGLNQRSAFFLGFFLWFVGLIVIAATTKETNTPVAVNPQGRGTHRARPAGTQHLAESLRQLNALHSEGLLTDDEYETKRQAVADQL